MRLQQKRFSPCSPVNLAVLSSQRMPHIRILFVLCLSWEMFPPICYWKGFLQQSFVNFMLTVWRKKSQKAGNMLFSLQANLINCFSPPWPPDGRLVNNSCRWSPVVVLKAWHMHRTYIHSEITHFTDCYRTNREVEHTVLWLNRLLNLKVLCVGFIGI